MIQTEFLIYLRDLETALYTYCVYSVSFGDAWPLWQDGICARDAAKLIAGH